MAGASAQTGGGQSQQAGPPFLYVGDFKHEEDPRKIVDRR